MMCGNLRIEDNALSQDLASQAYQLHGTNGIGTRPSSIYGRYVPRPSGSNLPSIHVARPILMPTHATSVFPSTWPAQEASNSSYILTTARPRVVLSNIRQHPTSASDQQQTTLLLNRVSINCNYGNDRFDNYIHQR